MPAVQGLLASANDSLQQGNFEAAAVSLERAQRLSTTIGNGIFAISASAFAAKQSRRSRAVSA
jgi:hypothetical protein